MSHSLRIWHLETSVLKKSSTLFIVGSYSFYNALLTFLFQEWRPATQSNWGQYISSSVKKAQCLNHYQGRFQSVRQFHFSVSAIHRHTAWLIDSVPHMSLMDFAQSWHLQYAGIITAAEAAPLPMVFPGFFRDTLYLFILFCVYGCFPSISVYRYCL